MLKNQRHSVDFMTGIKIIMRFILRLCLHRGTNITRKTQVPAPSSRAREGERKHAGKLELLLFSVGGGRVGGVEGKTSRAVGFFGYNFSFVFPPQ